MQEIDTLVVDTGPIISNFVEKWLKKCNKVTTTICVLRELRDKAARATAAMYWPDFFVPTAKGFIFKSSETVREFTIAETTFTVQTPNAKSIEAIKRVAQATGDLTNLSIVDLEILALCYEKNMKNDMQSDLDSKIIDDGSANNEKKASEDILDQQIDEINSDMQNLMQSQPSNAVSNPADSDQGNESDSSSSSEGWITPFNYTNIKEKGSTFKKPVFLKSAIATTDFAMQNVALKMNLNLVSCNSLQRIKSVKSWILRCYACFKTTKDMRKQFCPKCGNATLLKTSVTVKSDGQLVLHSKKNMFWRVRRRPMPKPQQGSANQKGPKNIILSEDQIEYQRALKHQKRVNKKSNIDLDDPDWLPNLVTGDRNLLYGKIKIGPPRDLPGKKKR